MPAEEDGEQLVPEVHAISRPLLDQFEQEDWAAVSGEGNVIVWLVAIAFLLCVLQILERGVDVAVG